MATNMHTPTLLTLPLELRNIIYTELLSSERSKPLVLYNYSKGRETFFNLYPSILRTNKQIYAEAISYLYNDNIFLLQLDGHVSRGCDIRSCTYHRRPILPLYRCDDAPHTAVFIDGEYSNRPRGLVTHINQGKKIYEDCRCHYPPIPGPGPIYPHILRRLAHIELYIGASSMWGVGNDGVSFTHTRKVVLDTLRLLAEEEIEDGLVTKKTLRVEVRAKWICDNLFLGDKGPSLSREEGQALKAEMLALLKEIKKRRVVEVKEAVLYEAPRFNEIKTVDIDTGEAF